MTDILEGLIALESQFQSQSSDVLLISIPKSGTTWVKALVFAFINRKSYPINQSHPLLTSNPHTLVPFIEYSTHPADDQLIADQHYTPSSNRLLSTHSPLVLLPKSVLKSRCKKDMFVSYWKFSSKRRGAEDSLEDTFDKFCRGVSICGPVWDHTLDYWKESLEKPPSREQDATFIMGDVSLNVFGRLCSQNSSSEFAVGVGSGQKSEGQANTIHHIALGSRFTMHHIVLLLGPRFQLRPPIKQHLDSLFTLRTR